MGFLPESRFCLKQVGRSTHAPGQAVPGSNSGDKVAKPLTLAQVPSGSAAC